MSTSTTSGAARAPGPAPLPGLAATATTSCPRPRAGPRAPRARAGCRRRRSGARDLHRQLGAATRAVATASRSRPRTRVGPRTPSSPGPAGRLHRCPSSTPGPELVRRRPRRTPHPRRRGMLQGVGDGLAVEKYAAASASGEAGVPKPDGSQPHPGAEAAGQGLEGRYQAQVGEDRRVDARGEVAHLRQGAGELLLGGVEQGRVAGCCTQQLQARCRWPAAAAGRRRAGRARGGPEPGWSRSRSGPGNRTSMQLRAGPRPGGGRSRG